MNNPDKYFRDKLYDLETPLNDRMSFEAVMARRKSATRFIWWKPALIIVAGLFAVTGSAYYLISGDKQTAKSGAESVGAVHKEKNNASAPASNAAPVAQIPKDADEQNRDGLNPSTSGTENAAHSRNADFRTRNPLHISPARSGSKPASPAVPEVVAAAEKNMSEGAADISRINLSGIDLFRLRLIENAIMPLFAGHVPLPNQPWYAEKSPLSKFSLELGVATAGNGYRNFDEKQDLSIRGNHRISQYQAVLLADLGYGWQAGAGISYQAGMGIAQVRRFETSNRMVVDTHTVIIVQPGLPPKTVVVRDTSYIQDRISKGSQISYRMNKVSVPLAFRYHVGQGRGIVRLSATLSPGLVTMQAGDMFNRTQSADLAEMPKHAFCMDARLGAGMYYQLGPKTALIAEPMLQLQAMPGSSWKAYNRVGLGFGLGVVIKP